MRIQRVIIGILAAFALQIAAFGQNFTIVTASHIQNGSQQLLPKGTICFTATDANALPINYQAGGGGQVIFGAICGNVVNGAITGFVGQPPGVFQVPNPANTVPAGILYTIAITDNTTSHSIPVLNYKLVSFSGATFNFDNYAPTGLAVLPPNGGSVAGPLGVNGNLTVTGSITATGGVGFYQTIQSVGNPLTQRFVTNFQNEFITIDNAGALRTDISINAPNCIDSAGQHLNYTAGTHSFSCGTSGASVVPTGTGFFHITGGVADGAARAVDLSGADATGIMAQARFPSVINAITGFQVSSAAGQGKVLIGDGTNFVPGDPLVQGLFAVGVTSATNPVIIGGYDTQGSPQIQRATFVASNPAGTEYGIVVRNIPSGTQPISGTIACSNCSSSGVSIIDEAAFTAGSSVFVPAGGVFNDGVASLTSGQQGVLRLTADRMLFANLGKWGGTALGTPTNFGSTPGAVIAGSINASLFAGTTALTQTGSALDLNLKTSSITLNVSAAQSGTWSGLRIVGNAGGIFDFAGQNATQPANSILMGGEFNTAPTTLTNGNASPLQLDNAGNLLVNLKANSFGTLTVAGSGNFTVTQATGTNLHAVIDSGSTTAATQATASNLNAQVVGNIASAGSDSGNPVKTGGVFNTTQPTVTTGQRVDMQMTARGGQIVSVGIDGFTVTANAGTNLNTSALALDTSINGILLAQASTTSGQKGTLIQGAVTTNAPSYTTAQTDPLSLDPSGLLRMSLKDTPSNTNNFNVNLAASAATVTVTGTVTANQGGSNWTQNLAQIAGTNTVTAGVSGLLAAGGNAASGASDAGNPLKIGGVFNTTQPTVTTGQRVDAQMTARGAQIVSTGIDTFNITCSNCSGSGVSTIDEAAATAGSSLFVGVGGVFNDSFATLTSGQQGFVRLTTDRMMFENLGKVGGAAIALGQTTMAASLPVTIASNQASFPVTLTSTTITGSVAVTQSGTWSGLRVVGNAGGIFDTTQNAAVAANSLLAGCNFTTSPTSITTGNQGALQCNSKGEILTQLTDGTTGVSVIAATNALKTDMSSIAGTATSTAASGIQKVGIVGGAAGTSLETTNGVLDLNIKNIGNTAVVTGGVSGLLAIGGNVAIADAATANPVPFGGIFQTSPTTLTNGQTAEAQFDSAQRLIVNCATGCSGSSFTDSGAFTAASTSINIGGGVFNDTLAAVSSGQAAAPRITQNREQFTNENKIGGQGLVPSIVQKTSNVSSGSVASLVKAYASNTIKGNTLITVCGVGNGTAPTIADTQSNTYLTAISQASGSAFEVYIFYSTNTAGGASTVTCTNAGAAASMAMEIYEVTGTLAFQPQILDQTGSATATGTAIFAGNVASQVPNELAIIGIGVGTGAQTITVTSPLANDSGQQNPTTPAGLFSFVAGSQFIPNAASISPAATITSEPWVEAVATFRPVALGVAGTFNQQDNTTTCTLNVNNQFCMTPLNGKAGATVAVTTGGASLSIIPYCSYDNNVTQVIQNIFINVTAGTTISSLANPASGTYLLVSGCIGATHAGVKVTAYTSGSDVVTIRASSNMNQTLLLGANSASSSINAIAAVTNNSGSTALAVGYPGVIAGLDSLANSNLIAPNNSNTTFTAFPTASMLYNGSTWDRQRTASIGDNVAATGILASADYGQYQATPTSATTGNYGAQQDDILGNTLVKPVVMGSMVILQKQVSKSTGSVASLTAQFPAASSPGNTIIAVCGVGNGTQPTFSDTPTNAFTIDKNIANSTNFNITFAHALMTVGYSATADTVTCSNGGTAASIVLEIYEVSGLFAPYVDQTMTVQSTTATVTASTSIMPTYTQELGIVAVALGTAAQTITLADAGGSGMGTISADSGQQNPTTPAGLFSMAIGSQFLPQQGAWTPIGTFTTEPYAIAAVTYRSVAGGASPETGTPANITSATTTTVKATSGILKNIIINTPVASATLKIYNIGSAGCSGTPGSGLLGTLTIPATITSDLPAVLNYNMAMNLGICMVTTGTTDWTIIYQ